jgi:hypothetical protein
MDEEIYVGPDEEWLVLTCHNPACRRTLLIEPVRPEMLDEDGAVTIPAETLQATCPHCGLESCCAVGPFRRR